MKSLTKGRIACAALVAVIAGLGITSAAGASTSTSSPSIPQGSFYIYTDFGPGNSYYCCVGWPVLEFGPVDISAMSFTPSSNAHVTQIDLALSYGGVGGNNATIELARDNGGIPGTILGAWSVAGQPAFGTCCSLTTVHTGTLIPVSAGQTYWVVAVAGPNASNHTEDAWNYNSTGATGGDFYSNGTWYQFSAPTGAFDVIGCGKICKVAP